MSPRDLPFISLLLLAGCGERQIQNGDEESLGTPEWSVCAMKNEVQSCAEFCAELGSECVANGCVADPEFCNPKPCDRATQVLALDAAAFCADDSLGTFVSTACDTPIDWLFSNTVRCCCAE